MQGRVRLSIRTWLVMAVIAGAVLVPITPAFAAVFTDGFESGTVAAWTSSTGVVVETTGGAFAPAPEGVRYARMNTTGASAYVQKNITNQSNLYVDAQVNLGRATSAVTLMRLLTAGNGQLVSLKIDKNAALLIKNHVVGGGPQSGAVLSKSVWHELELHATTSGSSSLIEVWLDGTKVSALTSTLSLGTTPIGQVQVGNKGSVSGGFDVAFDEVTIDTARIGGGGGTTPPTTPTGLHEVSHTSTRVTIAWDAVSGAGGYGVYRDGTFVVDVPVPTTTFTDAGLSPSTGYLYSVDAFNGIGRSAQSAQVSVTTAAAGGGGEDVVVMAAGDIACDPADGAFNNGHGSAKKCQQMATSNLLVGADTVFALGDTQYECAGAAAYPLSYDPSWGRFKSITYAIPADQEYETSGGTNCSANAAGYFGYFGARGGPQGPIPGVRSFNLPEGCTPGPDGDCTWHIIGLNSVCDQIGGCQNGSPMEQWLDQDLTQNDWAACTAVMLHLPRFSSKENGPQINDNMLSLWQDFVAHQVEFVLSGNNHYYERFAPQNALGQATPNGTVQWIVGTGGKSHGKQRPAGSRLPNSQAGMDDEFGVLKLTLHEGSYDWDFLPIVGGSFSDTGSRNCV